MASTHVVVRVPAGNSCLGSIFKDTTVDLYFFNLSPNLLAVCQTPKILRQNDESKMQQTKLNNQKNNKRLLKGNRFPVFLSQAEYEFVEQK